MQKKEKKKIWIGILIGAIVSVLALGTWFVLIVMSLLFGDRPQIFTDINQYKEALAICEGQQSGFIVFPEQISENAEETDFYFYNKDMFSSPIVEVFLQCTYTDEEYQAEVERLENTRKRYGGTVRTLLRDERGDYPYPVYIAEEGIRFGNEYAMLTGENQITYIFFQCKEEKTMEKIEAKYLPDYYLEEQAEWPESYSIYLIHTFTYGNGEISGWDCDYTRNEVVEALENSHVNVGYNRFYVTVALDENDRRIIKECSYMYYTSRYDSVSGLPDEILYTELAGYEFKSLELSEDETQAIVTYYDSGEEKMHTYDIPEV